MSKVFPIIAGPANFPSQENLSFGNLKDLTDGFITKAQPDFYDGSRPADLDKRIREELGPYIVPSTNTAAPCLPNFFTEGKGPNGNTAVCKRQALYDGALGARGIHELRSYVDPQTAYDKNAYTITSTYHGGSGTLALYITHPTLSRISTGSNEYRMTQLKAFAVTSDPETFRQGASALRNARDWAQERRQEVVNAANNKVLTLDHSSLDSSTQSFVSLSPNESAHLESETSADEPALAANAVSNYKASVGARKKSSPRVRSNRRLKRPVRDGKGVGTHGGDSQKT